MFQQVLIGWIQTIFKEYTHMQKKKKKKKKEDSRPFFASCNNQSIP